ncbi:UPF0060 membrane protein [Mesorhizobium sp. 113-1-2]|uniref:hypothetical protein n=1 Tax=Mesorhizobium sp. 113-1-2 TaxID=2744515 RepID=UPI001925AC2D|nr:hypothetical protein [Mesorhizobium sp. 113-1-2]BCG70659.1 UPF0060 membrane protein [Mesorhizobium sp. 113-1-2]
MRILLSSFLTFAAAALAEIAGCFAFWVWLRQGKSILWLAPGVASLVLFAYLLTFIPSDYAWSRLRGLWRHLHRGVAALAVAGRGHRPDTWDLMGGAIALLAVAIILFAPRST